MARQDGMRRFGRKSLAAAGVTGLLAAALLAFSAAELPRQQREASRWVEHTLQVLEQAATFDADLATVASEGRGYLLDRTADSIGRFEAASRQATDDLAGLRALTADNPVQQAALNRLDRLLARRIDHLREIIRHVQAGDEDGAAGLVQSQRGRVLADQIRDGVGGVRAEERRLLGVRDKGKRRAQWLTVATLVACGVLAAASGLFVVALLVGRKRERTHLAELQDSEARFRALFEQSPLLIHVFDPAGQTITVNPALQRAVGVPAQALRAFNVLQDPQPHQNGTRALLERTFAGEVTRTPPVRLDAAVAFSKGEAPWVEVTGYPVKDAAGRVREVVLLSHDVSERVAAQEQAREGEMALRGLNKELARRVEEFQMLADNIPTLCWMARADGHIHWYNRRWHDYMGSDPEKEESWGWASAHDPEVLPKAVERWQRSLATGEPFEMTFPLKGADGVFRPFLTRVVPIRDAEGRITRWFGTNTDITELREAERAIARHRDELERLVEARTAELSASEARYRLLTEHASDMVSRTGPDGTRLYVSAASARIFGVAPEALLGQHALERRVVPDDRPALDACLQRLLAGSVEEETVVYRVLHPGRGTVWVEATAHVLRDPGTGALDGFVAVSRDVTERRAAEAALEDSEARYRMLAESTSDAITVLDLQFRRTYVSPACRKVFGYEPEDMLGHEPAETVHPDDRDAVYARLRRLAAGEVEQERVVNRIRHKGGHLVWVEAGFSLVRDAENRPASIICTMRDVSERQTQADALHAANAELERLARHLARARDVAERASRAKSRFLAGMSHELRTPLNGILGYAELLRLEGGLNPAQATRVGAMLGAGQHLLDMINGVLDLSEIEEGHVELRPAAVDLRSLADACLDLVRPAADAKGLALTIDMAPSTPCSMTTDPTRLRQVLLNLIGNAAKFTAKGAVGLRLAATGDQLRIEVADTGAGIPAERRHLLFRDFERLGAETTAAEGAGLGLALSARLAALLGGRLGHEDNPGGGSVFWLELPLAALAAAPALDRPALPDAMQAAAAAVCPLRVLVVDDVAMNRDIARSFLHATGHEVECAEGGAEAVKLAAASDFDVILMDVRMPEMDGLEATRRIRALAGLRGRTPIVALTAQAFAEQVSKCRKAGMDSHLAKPFTPDALRDAVARAAAGPRQGDGMPQREASQPASIADGEPAAVASSANAGPPPVTGLELPVLDPAAFGRTAAYLSPKVLASHLQTIAGRGEALLRALHAPGALASTVADLSAAAHTLAGSAGMFGFERLSAVARGFEHAIQTSAPDAQTFADGLAAAIKASLLEMPALVPPDAAEADRTHEAEALSCDLGNER